MANDLRAGALARRGLLDADECGAAEDMIARIDAEGLETLRVLFVDQHGILRGKTLVAGAARSLFENGMAVPSTLLLKDTSHRTAFPVWSADSGIAAGPMQGASDVLLVPRPASFRTLPWADHSAWIFCDVMFRDGNPVPFSSVRVLEQAVNRLAAHGLIARIGLEVEFHLFGIGDPALNHEQATMPGQPVLTRNIAQGYQFLTETRYAEVETILDRLRVMAQKLGLPVRSVEIEMGPSQFEFTFDPADPMTQAMSMVMFRTMVKEVAGANGLHASFMAKPRLANTAANGWHIHQSLLDADTGRNLFVPDAGTELTAHAQGWVAGLLNHAAASSLLTAPTVNGYKRYLPYQLAPNRIQWGHDNRGAMLRALMQAGDPASRIENRAPDSSANPFFAIAAQLVSGLDGVTSGQMAPPPTQTPYEGDAARLPESLAEAIGAFDDSALYRSALGDEVVDYLLQIKRQEWARYLATVSEWEQAEYFNLF